MAPRIVALLALAYFAAGSRLRNSGGDEACMDEDLRQRARLQNKLAGVCESMCKEVQAYPKCTCPDFVEPDSTPGVMTWEELLRYMDQLADWGRDSIKGWHKQASQLQLPEDPPELPAQGYHGDGVSHPNHTAPRVQQLQKKKASVNADPLRPAADQVPEHTISCSPDGAEHLAAVETGSPGDFPVDVVYTWVAQPTEDEYNAMLKTCGHITGGMQRFRNLGTLRFSLRMLELNTPWVRNVFLVTNGAIPSWINTSSPKLKLIQHRDIWPADFAERDLPVYNSQAIEVHLHRIPGLSERFLYFNDDMFVGHPLEKSFFFASDGRPLQREKEKQFSRLCSASIPGSSIGEHMPYALTVSLIREMQARWPGHFSSISAARCRGDIKLAYSPPFHYQWYAVQSNQGIMHDVGRFAFLRDVNVNRMEEWCQEQLLNPPDLGCVNDDFELSDAAKFERQQRTLRAFMRNMSHYKASTFEAYDHNEERIAFIFLPRYVNGTLIKVPALVDEGAVRFSAQPAI